MLTRKNSLIRHFSVLIMLLGLAMTACKKGPGKPDFDNPKGSQSGGNGSGGSNPGPDDPVTNRISGTDKEPLKRLNKAEYTKVMTALFGSFVEASTIESMASDEIPGDVPGEVFDNVDQTISKNHVLAFNSFAEKLAISLTDSQKFLTAIGCTTLDKVCAQKYLSSAAPRLLRRPLTTEETAGYQTLFDSSGADKVGFATMVSALLQSPQFVYKIEVGDEKGDLTPYELASRISFAMTDRGPDDALWKKAETGLGGTLVNEELERLFDSEMAKQSLKGFLLQWLGQKRAPPPGYSQAYLEGLDPKNLGVDALKEIENLLEQYVWASPGTITDIFTTRKAFNGQSSLKAIYEKDTGGTAENLAPYRAGVQGRVSFLMTGTDASHLVHRGILVRRNFLCDKIVFPTIDPNNKDEFAPPKPDPNASTRKQIESRTAAPTCQACHSRINPPGFAFEAFDGVGRFRTEEKVFDPSNGNLLARLPVDTKVEGGIEPGVTSTIVGPESIAALLGESETVKKCFVKRWFQYVSRRELTSKDSCYLEQMDAALKEGKSIKELMIETLSQSGFQKLKPCK